MVTRSGLTLLQWRQLKQHFRREQAFAVSLQDRSTVRFTLSILRSLFPHHAELIQAIPVSTTAWSSCSIKVEQRKVALVDVEQANAICFLLARSLFLERPLFSYSEFMIRAAETAYADGDRVAALRISALCNERLHSYARSLGSSPYISRPFVIPKGADDLILSNAVLAFVCGHEIGHLTFDVGTSPILDWVRRLYKQNESEPAKHFEKGTFMRFLKPETVQKFTPQGQHNGDLTQGAKLVERWGHVVTSQVSECHADVLGLIAATEVAHTVGVEPRLLFRAIFELLECSEMLITLKRLLPRIPRAGSGGNVPHEHTSLGVRRYMFVSALQAIRDRELVVPKTVRDFWLTLPEAFMADMIAARDAGEIESVSNRVTHLARGAVHMGVAGDMPPAPTPEQVKAAWGVAAGTGFFLYSYLTFPKAWFDIGVQENWEPSPQDESIAIGFGSALRDICAVLRNSDFKDNILDEHGAILQASSSEMLALVRHPRTQIFERRIADDWPNQVGGSLFGSAQK